MKNAPLPARFDSALFRRDSFSFWCRCMACLCTSPNMRRLLQQHAESGLVVTSPDQLRLLAAAVRDLFTYGADQWDDASARRLCRRFCALIDPAGERDLYPDCTFHIDAYASGGARNPSAERWVTDAMRSAFKNPSLPQIVFRLSFVLCLQQTALRPPAQCALLASPGSMHQLCTLCLRELSALLDRYLPDDHPLRTRHGWLFVPQTADYLDFAPFTTPEGGLPAAAFEDAALLFLLVMQVRMQQSITLPGTCRQVKQVAAILDGLFTDGDGSRLFAHMRAAQHLQRACAQYSRALAVRCGTLVDCNGQELPLCRYYVLPDVEVVDPGADHPLFFTDQDGCLMLGLYGKNRCGLTSFLKAVTLCCLDDPACRHDTLDAFARHFGLQPGVWFPLYLDCGRVHLHAPHSDPIRQALEQADPSVAEALYPHCRHLHRQRRLLLCVDCSEYTVSPQELACALDALKQQWPHLHILLASHHLARNSVRMYFRSLRLQYTELLPRIDADTALAVLARDFSAADRGALAKRLAEDSFLPQVLSMPEDWLAFLANPACPLFRLLNDRIDRVMSEAFALNVSPATFRTVAQQLAVQTLEQDLPYCAAAFEGDRALYPNSTRVFTEKIFNQLFCRRTGLQLNDCLAVWEALCRHSLLICPSRAGINCYEFESVSSQLVLAAQWYLESYFAENAFSPSEPLLLRLNRLQPRDFLIVIQLMLALSTDPQPAAAYRPGVCLALVQLLVAYTATFRQADSLAACARACCELLQGCCIGAPLCRVLEPFPESAVCQHMLMQLYLHLHGRIQSLGTEDFSWIDKYRLPPPDRLLPLLSPQVRLQFQHLEPPA